jgi:hypothetical protein
MDSHPKILIAGLAGLVAGSMLGVLLALKGSGKLARGLWSLAKFFMEMLARRIGICEG